MKTSEKRLKLSGHFTKAIEYARRYHREYRKETTIPYMAHLLGVAALVMGEADGPIPVTEEMIIAAILHDVVEDHGGLKRLKDVGRKFGPKVMRMVEGLSDSFEEDSNEKLDWKTRKEAYLERLSRETEDVLLISIADKLYNATAILNDLNAMGLAVWRRFKVGADLQIWYFQSLLAIFQSHNMGRILGDFKRVVRDLKRAAHPKKRRRKTVSSERAGIAGGTRRNGHQPYLEAK